jgi:hypothetical protein
MLPLCSAVSTDSGGLVYQRIKAEPLPTQLPPPPPLLPPASLPLPAPPPHTSFPPYTPVM